jgi:hypothetical protein
MAQHMHLQKTSAADSHRRSSIAGWTNNIAHVRHIFTSDEPLLVRILCS